MERGINQRQLRTGVALELAPYAAYTIGLQLRYSHHIAPSDATHALGLVLFLLFFVSGVGWIVARRPGVGLAVFLWRIVITMIVFIIVTRFGCIGYCGGEGMSPWFGTIAGLVVFGLPAVSAFSLWRWDRAVKDDDVGDADAADDHGIVDPGNAPNPSA